MEENIITITGQAKIKFAPDVTRINLKLASLHESYEEAYLQAKNDIDKLSAILKRLKLDPALAKTVDFDISKRTRREYDKQGHYLGDKFLGYGITHRAKIDLGMDNVLLHKVIKAIGTELKHAEIDLGYTVEDPRPYQLEMLEKAVEDAKEKALVMAKACGCSLGKVKEIKYAFDELRIYRQGHRFECCEEADAVGAAPESLDLTPDDMEVSDHVNVQWRLINPEDACSSSE